MLPLPRVCARELLHRRMGSPAPYSSSRYAGYAPRGSAAHLALLSRSFSAWAFATRMLGKLPSRSPRPSGCRKPSRTKRPGLPPGNVPTEYVPNGVCAAWWSGLLSQSSLSHASGRESSRRVASKYGIEAQRSTQGQAKQPVVSSSWQRHSPGRAASSVGDDEQGHRDGTAFVARR